MPQEIISGIYQIETRWRLSNAFLIVEDELTLIDTGLNGSQRHIVRFLNELGRSPNEITQIIITHCHLDHAGSVAALKELTGAKIAAHKAEADYVSKVLPLPYRKRPAYPMSWALHLLFLRILNYPGAKVDILLEDGSVLHPLGGLQVIHTPGHAPGHICLYSPERRILFPGDLMTVRRSSLALPGNTYAYDLDQAFISLRKLRGLSVDVLCPSHGNPLTNHATAELEILLNKADRRP